MVLPPALLAAALLAPAQPAAPPRPELRDGDRVVWLGNTLVEREQRYGYWETALYAANPGKRFTVRNLGWSGDTVFGEARAAFDPPAKGFERMVNLTLELKPTTVWVAFGANESFEGAAGLPRFEQGLNKLLDSIRPANARVVLFTPAPVQAFPKMLSAEARDARMKDLALYAESVKKVAAARGLALVDLFTALQPTFSQTTFTENGVHPTADGFRDTAAGFLTAVGGAPRTLEWKQLDALRIAVVAKNELFFHRWRPQNETYLFGFRKHEQGKNAKEIAEFDPLVATAETAVEAARAALQK
ncbi:SGNH/GDSL hydrolase family protein [Urbifossiella limnaea]|uniref:GDSL-like Lipase/Acylhydrolase n=1 Tax=Urbifossiella limnaea TaxID=2528023 RepID=A0A517XV66_9BACT|nr:SGNH/GDSL hydrolase family protein [Urbifossiella limnaea]QDU21387.1 GDSL-like Lipase/Acylhydrolase [Urbifossiella limnaea]